MISGNALSSASIAEEKKNQQQRVNSNFMHVLKLIGRDPTINRWLERQANKYILHEIQNEFLKIIAHQVLRKITSDIQSSRFLTILADETSDQSNNEQLVNFVFRRVAADLEVHEEFIELYYVPLIDAETITSTIEDTGTRLKQPVSKHHSRCL